MNSIVEKMCKFDHFKKWSDKEQESYVNYWTNYYEGKSCYDDKNCLSNKYRIFQMIFMFLFTMLIKYAKFIGYKNTSNDQSEVEAYLLYAWWDEFDPENKARNSN